MADGRFYWLKLKRDFFKRHDIQIIEAMPNGKDYILFYLKLLCESVDHEGQLRFSESIPYNEEMLSTITNTNVDIVRSAINAFSQLDMIEILDDGTLYMTECEKMIGSAVDNDNANRQRRFRERQKLQALPERYDGVTKNNESKRESKSIESEKEKMIPKGITKEKTENEQSVDPELDQALNDFAMMRKAIKAPLTERAKQLILAKLEKLAPDTEGKIAILNQSIENGWKGIYPVKDETQQRSGYMTKGQQIAKDLQDAYAMTARWAAEEGEE